MKRTLVILGLALALPVQAEVLQLPEAGAQATAVDRSALPRNGISMARVEERYGAPLSVSGPVGDPPITRWNYDGFAVFFERDLVINAIIPSKPSTVYHQDELRRSGGQ